MGLLDDQVCIVTGAGQGLGEAISLEMAREGATLVLLERNPETAEKVATRIRANGGKTEPYAIDVTDYGAYREVVDDVVRTFGGID
ncbi:MAG: SDR family NAD(P)-dependent oxidoreductase, partial [Hyphomicrobiales bacterium]